MIIPNNLQRQFSLHADEYKKKVCDVLDSGWYILGKEVSSFEEEWAKYVGSKYCVGLASGLDALWISFRLLGIGANVVSCSYTYSIVSPPVKNGVILSSNSFLPYKTPIPNGANILCPEKAKKSASKACTSIFVCGMLCEASTITTAPFL